MGCNNYEKLLEFQVEKRLMKWSQGIEFTHIEFKAFNDIVFPDCIMEWMVLA